MKISLHVILTVCLTAGALFSHSEASTTHADSCISPEWRAEIPQPVHPNKDWVELYYKTWEIAAGRVRKGPQGLPASPYLDENCYEEQIWIWDTCFMVLFAKYAPQSFPGIESLDNFYKPILEGSKTPLLVHLVDNPPLFAWIEKEYYDFTGDSTRLQHILHNKQYLQKHYKWFAAAQAGQRFECSPQNIYLHAVGEEGFTWTGGASGMDNTPRGRDAGGYNKVLWVDAIAQQALTATCLAEMERTLGDEAKAQHWEAVFAKLKTTINELYWDPQDQFYYDVAIADKKPCRIKTMASYWPLLAQVASPEQAAAMVEHLMNPAEFGGQYPTPSLARSDKDYNHETGDYWRGGIWMPTSYMGIKAIENYGYYKEADGIAAKLIQQQWESYQQHEPHTIWECYSPSSNAPSTEHGRRARPEFCGWSALGPITLFIENILGFKKISAAKGEVHWRLKPENGEHGIKKLRFGSTVTDLIFDGKQSIYTNSNRAYKLFVNGAEYTVQRGVSRIQLQPELI